MNIKNGKLVGIPFLKSPHYNNRPDGVEVDLIIIHSISLPPGNFHGNAVEDLFMNRLDSTTHPYFETIQSLKVSSHLFIRRDGHTKQFVSFDDRAWHAGVSSFQGREECNDFSIGIELEGHEYIPFEKKQYEQLGHLVTILMQHYPRITKERIIGHDAVSPGRKTDPGPSFDWDYFFKFLGN